MKQRTPFTFRRAAATLFAVAAVIAWAPLGAGPALSGERGWEAVAPEVGVGKAVRIEVRMKGAATAPQPQDIKVTSSRLDMGPDGMAMMEAPVKAVPSGQPGVLAFEADLMMAGRWELKFTATAPGMPAPVAGSVIFTAVEKKPKGSALDRAGGPRKTVRHHDPMGIGEESGSAG